jgi:ribokinase
VGDRRKEDCDRDKEAKQVMLLVTGSLNYDITLFVDYFAPPKSVVRKIKRFLGGSGGNSAVAAARILGKGKVYFLGGLGNDLIGKEHLKSLEKEGIQTGLIILFDDVESGQAFVAVDPKGDTAIYSYYGANERVLPDKIDEKVIKVINEVKALLITNPPLSTALTLAEIAKNKGKLVIWDPGAVSHLGLNVLAPMMRFIDYLAPNKGELISMTGENDIFSAVKKIWALNPSIKVISKEGKEGSRLFKESKWFAVSGVPPEALGLKTTSTVGCGDAYIGVFTAFKVLGRDDLEAMQLATCAATLNASMEEPRGSPTLDSLLKWFGPCSTLIKIKEGNI